MYRWPCLWLIIRCWGGYGWWVCALPRTLSRRVPLWPGRLTDRQLSQRVHSTSSVRRENHVQVRTSVCLYTISHFSSVGFWEKTLDCVLALILMFLLWLQIRGCLGLELAQLFAPEPGDPVWRDDLHDHLGLPGNGKLRVTGNHHQRPGHAGLWQRRQAGAKAKAFVPRSVAMNFHILIVTSSKLSLVWAKIGSRLVMPMPCDPSNPGWV